MSLHCYTSFTFSYLNRARVLAASLRRRHPDAVLWAVVTDEPPAGLAFDPTEAGYDHVIWGQEIYGAGSEQWLFQHELVEACTAVKGRALQIILEAGAEKVVYFDPDIALFTPMTEIIDALDDASIVLTPHQLAPDDRKGAILDNEIGSLIHGVYNLGFLGVRNDAEGRRFADWWEARLRDFCHDDVPHGLFVDQRWCDLIPAFFPRHRIHRDPGCNVASWNLSQRRIRIDGGGSLLVNDRPLVFYHFTKLGPIGDVMTQRYASDGIEVFELWAWYARAVAQATDPAIPKGWWRYGRFHDDTPIPRAARLLYRGRADLREAFPHPFTGGGENFAGWLRTEGLLDAAANNVA